jgi:hypothetical protein
MSRRSLAESLSRARNILLNAKPGDEPLLEDKEQAELASDLIVVQSMLLRWCTKLEARSGLPQAVEAGGPA